MTQKTPIQSPTASPSGQDVPPRPVAVIDIGATSIRMAVAEIGSSGQIRELEAVARPVDLGRDSFTRGTIQKATTEACVGILRDFLVLLEEYQIEQPANVRVVTTSAVREADNSLAFMDRIRIATGLRVRPIDDAEVHRLAYLSVLPLVQASGELSGGRTLVVEVGGGSTTVLLLHGTDVAFSHTYRLGALRLPELLRAHRAPVGKAESIIQDQVRRTVDRVRRDVHGSDTLRILALGGDARFAASSCNRQWRAEPVYSVPNARLKQLVDEVLPKSLDELVNAHALTYHEAETLGPALLTYLRLAQAFQTEELLVSSANLRGGLLTEMAEGDTWNDAFAHQIIRSALDLGRRYGFDEEHGRHTAELARSLYEALRPEHGLDPRTELLLYVAGLLHDIGMIVGPRSHHKHSMYLILNSDLFGLGREDLLLISLVARYHRRANPKPIHEGYASLDDDSRIAVAKMAAILRIADALDRSESQRVREIRCHRENGDFVIIADGVEDLSLEQLAVRQKAGLFENLFGMEVVLRNA